MKKTKKKKNRKIVSKILFVLALCVSVFAGFWIARTQIVFSSVNQNKDNAFKQVKLPKGNYKSDNNIVNILIIGNDYRKESGYSAAGLPDVMMIATLDKKHKNLKLTSLLRDQVVDIPGHAQNRLNSCFGYGEDGPTLLYKTIAQNYNIKLDGYVEVGFDAVKAIVNAVGGVEIELTESEAAYLNATNYIRPAKYRNVKAGTHILNGTWRQRNVINAIFNKAKGTSLPKLMDMAQTILSKYVTTDLNSQDIIGYMKDVVMMGTMEIYQLQIPMDGYFTTQANYQAPGSTTNLGSVILPDMTTNTAALKDFIFKYKGTPGQEYTYGGSTAAPQ